VMEYEGLSLETELVVPSKRSCLLRFLRHRAVRSRIKHDNDHQEVRSKRFNMFLTLDNKPVYGF